MIRPQYKAYVGATSLAAMGLCQALDWGYLNTFSTLHIAGLVAFILLGLASEYNALTITAGGNVGNTSTTFILVFASILLFGPAASVIFVASIGIISEVFFRRKVAYKAVFNIAQCILSTALASMTYRALGGEWSPETFSLDPLAFASFGLALIGSNQVIVAAGISLNEGVPVRRVLAELSGEWGSNVIYDLFVSPVGLIVAYLYVNIHIWGLVIALLLLEFIRHAYLTKLQLQRAIKDLTRALVKAIETRDPYTSGHSLRVSSLVKYVAEGMGLPPRQCETIETAALLHDIGKIDAIYEEILMKPGDLSAAEREVIKSHVEKGVDLLRTLHSFDEEVIAIVRHHHERYDGQGYPDRLEAMAIPLGARIIKVCDAIDAMLSDRPYRKALNLPAVREQLSMYAGSQFDPEVVDAISTSNILEKHAMELGKMLPRDRQRVGEKDESAPKVRMSG